MTKLEKLINELCPNGVEYKQLIEIFHTKNGYTPSKSNKLYWENGNIPWFRMEDIRENGRILDKSLQYVTSEAVKGKPFPANSIIVATSATIGEHALITVESLSNQRFTYLILKDEYKEKYDIKFLYYFCFKLDEYCLQCLNQGNFASVDMKKFAKFEFPIPPLEVQREIVRILDNFTELTNELTEKLTAELVARKKQYEYYRDELLTFDDKVPMVKLSDIVEIRGRIGFRGYNSKDIVEKGKGAISLSPKNIKNNALVFCDDTYISWEKYYESPEIIIEKTDIILCKTGSTLGKVAIVDVLPEKTTINPQLVVLKNIKCNNEYLKYYMTSYEFQNKIQRKKGLGSVPNISQKEIGNIYIRLPSNHVQNSIVSILDRFDALCNDLTSGLLAEIEARKKQYEYYRDKLLTFKPLS